MGYVPAVVGDPTSRTVPLPLVYALLSSKSEEEYKAVFDAVNSQAGRFCLQDFEPDSIMSDFEFAILNAAEDVFPDIQMSCCFFHLKQSVFRKIQDLGLQRAYNDATDSSVRDFCKH